MASRRFLSGHKSTSYTGKETDTLFALILEKNLIHCFHQHQSLVLAQVPLRKRTGNPDTGEGSAAQSLPKDPRSEFVEDANKHTLKTQTTQFFRMGKILT